MKDVYITPETEVIRFESEDVITTSGIGDDTNGNIGDIIKG
ncbi:hypothetical protein [Ruminococcus sp.]|nr:hypothetical protein [Ruminococcus sp.]